MARRKSKSRSNTLLLAVIATIALGGASVLPWGYTQNTSKVSGDALLNLSARLAAAATGKGLEIDSSIRLTQLGIPGWFICMIGIAGVGCLAARQKGAISGSIRKISRICTTLPLVFALFLLFFLLNGGIQIGYLLLVSGSGLGCFLAWKHA